MGAYRHIAGLALAALLLLISANSRADDLNVTIEPFVTGIPNPYFVTISVRPGAVQPFLYMERKHPDANVILFTGGNGVLGISPSRFATQPSNFLVRSRDLFFQQNFSVAVVDVPSDVALLPDFPFGPEHAQDVAGVMEFLRRRSHAPVWLIGTSNGTVSVVAVAAQLHGRDAPDGIVLTSSKLGGNPKVFDADLGSIHTRTLLVHHVQDGCFATLYSDLPPLLAALTNARNLKLISVDGGGPPNGDPCEPWGFHGFPGQEAKVVDAIADTIVRSPRDHR